MRIVPAEDKGPKLRVDVVELGELKPTDCFHRFNPDDSIPEKEQIKELMMVTAPSKDGKTQCVCMNSGETGGSTDLNRSFSNELLVVKRDVTLVVAKPKLIPVVN
jgi:hypothetical protein